MQHSVTEWWEDGNCCWSYPATFSYVEHLFPSFLFVSMVLRWEKKEGHEEKLGCSRVTCQSFLFFTTLLFWKLVQVMAFDARENPGCQSISYWIKMIPFVPLTWRPQWNSLINSIFSHVNLNGSVIANLTDDGVVLNALKWLCCTAHKSVRMQKLKGNRHSTEHTETLGKFFRMLSALRFLWWVSPGGSDECSREAAVLRLSQKA